MLFVDDFQVLIVPGLHNSDSRHWQTRWQALYPAFERVNQDDWQTPALPKWTARLEQAISAASKPVILVAHSFGCLAAVAASAHPSIAAALLVGPADPVKFQVDAELKAMRLPFPSVLVASENDPWMSSRQAAYWARCWGSEYLTIGRAGHINSESGLADWWFGLAQLQRLTMETCLSLPSLPCDLSSITAARTECAGLSRIWDSGYLEMNKYYF